MADLKAGHNLRPTFAPCPPNLPFKGSNNLQSRHFLLLFAQCWSNSAQRHNFYHTLKFCGQTTSYGLLFICTRSLGARPHSCPPPCPPSCVFCRCWPEAPAVKTPVGAVAKTHRNVWRPQDVLSSAAWGRQSLVPVFLFSSRRDKAIFGWFFGILLFTGMSDWAKSFSIDFVFFSW